MCLYFFEARLQQMINRPATQELGQNEIRTLVMLIFIVALLTENCNFDNLRKEQQSERLEHDPNARKTEDI